MREKERERERERERENLCVYVCVYVCVCVCERDIEETHVHFVCCALCARWCLQLVCIGGEGGG